MKKKRKKSMKKNRGLLLGKNKLFFGTFTLLFSLVLVISATMAWSSYSGWVKNHVQSEEDTQLFVSIEETFTEPKEWMPGSTVKKEVGVKNVSSKRAFVRVKLKEHLQSFQFDAQGKTGNGNLITTQTAGTMIEREDINTWKIDHTYNSGLKEEGNILYYKATDSTATINQPLVYPEADRNSNILSVIDVTFGSRVDNEDLNSGDFWYFDSSTGYFYFSTPLEEDESTVNKELLLAKVKMKATIPNNYKGALYQISIEAEGIAATEEGIKEWVPNETSTLYEILKRSL